MRPSLIRHRMASRQPSHQNRGRSIVRLFLMVFLWSALRPATTAAGISQAESHPLPASTGRTLSLDDRLACQTAIERVYWDHRLWPAENPGPKPALYEVVPPAAIRTKVENNLRRASALTDLWQQEITGPMLQAEINRMAAGSQQPAILAELWGALNNDPSLIAECLARPVLENRLLRNFHEVTAGNEAGSFSAWWTANAHGYSAKLVETPAFNYMLPAITSQSPAASQPDANNVDAWQSTPAIPFYTDGTAVWSGVEMLYFGGSGSNQGYRYDPATDTWDQLNLFNVPVGRRQHTAVWTGTEMIVWGGCTGSNHRCDMDSGGRYNPATNTWTPTSEPGDVSPRTRHAAVWTGEVMVIWGGCSFRGTDFCTYYPPEGGRYNPTTDTWQTTTTVSAPQGRTDPRAVWTGNEMLIWTRATFPGGRYDPVADSWQPMSSVNAPPGTFGSFIWTGSEAIAWGGCTGSPNCQTPENTGGRYDPATDTWTPTGTTNAPAGRWFHGAVWTGIEMIVFGGTNGPEYFNTGGRYNPATDTWTATSTVNAPSKRYDLDPVWTGEQMIIWGGRVSTRTGGRYDPATDTWTPVSEVDPGANRTRHAAVWTGTEMIIWGGEVGVQHYDFGSVYDAILDEWWLTSTANAPFGYTAPSAVWTGAEMLVWGGHGSNFVNSGGRYNPATDTWTMMTFTNAPEGRGNHAEVWSGTELIIWGGSTWFDETDNTGGRYNPATDTWTALGLSNVPEGRRWHTAVWAGDEMIIWGGRGPAGELNSGGRYDPATNSWTPVTTSGAPSPRELQSAVWSGSEMIIWGGGLQFSGQAVYNDGGRYDPATNSWTPTSLANAPEGRIQQKTVWSGEEMIIWGGCAGSIFCIFETSATGGRYDPVTDSWVATTMFHAPEARQGHSAVWTGFSMIVWGGLAQESGIAHTGGIYFPTAPANTAPVASDDAFETAEDQTLNVLAPGVLANDSDPDGNSLTALLVTPTASGSLALNRDGSFIYTPDPGFAGLDAFTYQASDGLAASNVATVTITVDEAPNNAPTAVDDAYTMLQDSTLIIPAPGLLENDSDPDGDPLIAALELGPSNGSVTVNADGSFTYVPDAGFSGVDSFVYEVDDGQGGTDTAVVTITVHAAGPTYTVYLPSIQN
jgi:N-acetylneuraminic acid mutarotase